MKGNIDKSERVLGVIGLGYVGSLGGAIKLGVIINDGCSVADIILRSGAGIAIVARGGPGKGDGVTGGITGGQVGYRRRRRAVLWWWRRKQRKINCRW